MIVVGAIAVVTGAVWVGQGMNLIPGSFMTGDRTWLFIGLVVAVAGVVLVSTGLRRSRGRRP
jgi:carbonic anhydrase/acetyltransferase-like protein (isoleucine patch superfamily)